MNYRRLKYACYTANISMSVVATLSPILFLTFRNLYDISYSLLGLLILINFVTQLFIDLIFSFFSHKFNIAKTVTFMPAFTIAGLIIYSVFPLLFPHAAYSGLVIGTILFSMSAGLCEVLLSPVIASIPAENPEREMSNLHASYAWGVVFVVIFSTLFLLVAGKENWHWLALLLALIPTCSFLLFLGTKIPKFETPSRVSGVLSHIKNKTLWLCILMIFFGGASELAMTQWSSSFMEQALGIPKVWGDILGVAFFSIMLGTGRSLYAKFGRNITRVLLFGIIGAALCYFTVAVSNHPFFALLACAFTGLCTSMLWPGCLIVATDRIPSGDVFIYALMAAGGDLGASIAPQLIGIVTDIAIKHPSILTLAQNINATPEQLGLKLGMFVGLLFPLLAIPLYFYIHQTTKKVQKS